MVEIAGPRLADGAPEVAAFRLLEAIASSQGRPVAAATSSDCRWLLDTYVECLQAVRAGPRPAPAWGGAGREAAFAG